ncbi:MAG: hypothetical protein U0457_07810 [Candidatus Sericytochromatia bacterium]
MIPYSAFLGTSIVTFDESYDLNIKFTFLAVIVGFEPKFSIGKLYISPFLTSIVLFSSTHGNLLVGG